MHNFPSSGGYLELGIMFHFSEEVGYLMKGAGQAARANPSHSHTLLGRVVMSVEVLLSNWGKVWGKLLCREGFSFR